MTMPNDDTEPTLTPEEADKAIDDYTERLDDTSERLAILRRSIRASRHGDHSRSARLLDILDDMDRGDSDDE